MADRVVRVRLVADIGDYERKMKSAAKATDDLTGGTGRTASGMAQMASKAALIAGGIVVAGKAVIDFTKDAARLEQSVGATASVFQDASGRINAFAEDSVDAVGLSERAYRDLAAVAGAQLKSLGFSVDEAATTANQLVTIGADLAATFGGTTEEAVSALGAAFRGEADPAERFGLRLNQTAVNAKAVELGLAATTGEVSANAKAQATLALVMEQSADSAGQFAREADTLAGAQQRANAEWENAKAALGEKLLPVVTDATNAFSALLGLISEPTSKDSWWNALVNQRSFDAVQRILNQAPEVERELKRVNDETDRQARLSRAAADAVERNAVQLEEYAKALDGVMDATFAAIDADFAYRRSLDATEEAVLALRDGEGDLADDLLATEGAALAQADAAVRLAEENAKAAGQTFGAADKARIYRDELQRLKERIPELGPVIDGYIAKIDAIPENVQTSVQAQADLASVDHALAVMQQRADDGIIVAPRPGQVIRRAFGGVDANVANAPTILYGERQTGMEAFVPQKGISRQRATDILGQAANWYGYGLMELAQGGLVAPARMPPNALADILQLTPALSAGIGWQAMWSALKGQFPWAALFSAFRPGAITATGNPSYHGKGRAIDVSPSMDIFNWIAGNYPGSKEVIYSPAGGRQIRNGGRHFYGEPTRGDHWCVPLDVEILTRRGWLHHDELRVGDETPGLNWQTGQTEWTPVLAIHRYDSAEVFEAGNNRGWAVRTTAAHRWVTQRGPTGKYGTTTTAERTSASWLVAASLADGPGVDITDGEAELLGWLLTDGSQWEGTDLCSFDGCDNPSRARGLCGSHSRQAKRSPLSPLRGYPRGAAPDFSLFVWQTKPVGVIRLAAILGNRASWNGKGYRLRDEYARDLLSRAGLTHVKNGTELSELMFRMTQRQRQLMLAGVIGGDGTAQNGWTGDPVDDATAGRANKWKILQDEGPLLDVIVTLASLCGYRTRAIKRSFTDGRKRNGVNMYVSLASPRVWTTAGPRRSVGVIPVWCPTTALGTWTARQGHDVFLTMNSHVHWAMAQGGILGGPIQQVNETIQVVVDGATLAQTQRTYTRQNSGR